MTPVAPSITIVKSVDTDRDGDSVFTDSETVSEGALTAAYQFTVTNTSGTTDPLTITSFDDPVLNAAGVTDAALLAAFQTANGGSLTLAPGASVTFTVTGVALTLDDGQAGQDPYINTVTVNAVDDEGSAASDTDTATLNVTPVAPSITIVKSANPVVITESGGLVTFTYEVSNTSASPTDPLTIISLVDDNGTPADASDDFDVLVTGTVVKSGGNEDNLLEQGETWTYSVTKQIDPADAVSITNVATVTAEDDDGETVSDTDDATVDVASLSLDKSVQSVKNADGSTDVDGVVDTSGDVVTYQFVVSNTGNVSLTNVTLTDYFEDDAPIVLDDSPDDPNLTIVESGLQNGILDVGETWTYTLRHVVTADELEAARNVVTETYQVGFFTCYIEKCTGDLDLDNYAIVTAEANGYTVSDDDAASVDVTCPVDCSDDGYHDTYGGSLAEQLWYASQSTV